MIGTKTTRQDINTLYFNYAQNPCGESLEAVVAGGEGLIRHFASIYGGGCSFDDLCQTGAIGLLRAVRSYDPDSGTQFSTWAASCVISEIRHYVRRETSTLFFISLDDITEPYEEAAPATSVREPMHAFQLAVEDRIALEQAMATLSDLQRHVIDALFYRELSQEQAAKELGLTQRKVSRVRQKSIFSLAGMMEVPNFRLIAPSKTFKRI